MNENKKEGLYLHEWAYKKGEQIWDWYSKWVDRHPKIVGIFLALVMFTTANDMYNKIQTSNYPVIEWFCIIVFSVWGIIFLYAGLIYKSKKEVI